MMEPLSLSYDVLADNFSRAGEASGAVKGVLKKLGVAPEIVRRVAIAMYEAEINMVIHANGGKITVVILPDEIDITLADVGPGIPDISLAMTEGYSTATDQVRDLGFGAGMGLPNIKKYADYLDVQTELGIGTTVNIKIKV
ncbi:MAG: ATP-binding protein [Oscillospiraceae bacterium]|nr:ATP-binding protein [Oscillospiraceae bacterium]